ncbi:MAG: GAF domain-containing protein [Sandaracinaceae bacterium]|nr:GAF domain-containing protein [Sandaracinaceae bacterium]
MVTEIGGSAVVSEATVEAGNWMTALKLARAAIGESGGVPPGASCNVSPDGRVTIHDAVARRTYSLAPDTQTSFLGGRTAPSGPQVPADRVPRPSSVPPPSQVMADRKARSQTVAYDAGQLGLAALAAHTTSAMGAQAAPSSPSVPQRTIAYDARELGLAPVAETSPAPKAAEAKVNDKKRSPKATVAYDAGQLGLMSAPQANAAVSPAVATAPAAVEPGSPGSSKKKKIPQSTIAYDARELGLMPPAAIEAPPAAPAVEPVAPAEPARVAEPAPRDEPAPADEIEGRVTFPDGVDDAPSLVLIHARDAEPDASSPLCYRERVYFAASVPSAYVLEALLSARFEELRADLEGRPKGKLVNLAVFDHAWEGRPERPPLVTLQWKDWRGEPVIQIPALAAEAIESAPSVTTPAASSPPESAASAPAPSSPPSPTPAAATPPAAASVPPPAVAPSTPPPSTHDASHVSPPPATPPAAAAGGGRPPPRRRRPRALAPPPAATAALPPAAALLHAAARDHCKAPPGGRALSTPPPAATQSRPPRQLPAAAPSTPRLRPRFARGRASTPPPAAAPSTPPPATTSAPPPAVAPSTPPMDAAQPRGPAPSVPPPPRASAPPPRVSQPPPRDDRLAIAFEALQDLFFLTTPMEGVDFVMQLLDDLIPSEARGVCLYDINTDELRFVALAGPGADERQGEGVPRLSGLLGVAALSPNHPFLVEDAANDDRFDPGVDGRIGLEVETLAVVALSHQGRLLGAVQLINRLEQMQFSRTDANILQYIAEKLAEFLYAARLGGRG